MEMTGTKQVQNIKKEIKTIATSNEEEAWKQAKKL